MVEGRISAGVVVGDGSDVGGGASIMGTLSGGGTHVVSIGRRCLVGANAGIGISLGDDCVVEAGCYVTAGTKRAAARRQDRHRQGAELSGRLRPAVLAQLRHRRRRGAAPGRAAGRAQRGAARERLTVRDDRRSHRPRRRAPRSEAPAPVVACRCWCSLFVASWRVGGWACWRGVLGRAARCATHCTATALGSSTELEPRAGRQRGDHRRRRRQRRLARPGRDHRHRDRDAGVQAGQPRRRRPRLARPVPAAAVAGLGHAAPRSATRCTRATRSTTCSSRSRATRTCRSPRRRRRCSARPSRGVRRPRARGADAGLGADRLLTRRLPACSPRRLRPDSPQPRVGRAAFTAAPSRAAAGRREQPDAPGAPRPGAPGAVRFVARHGSRRDGAGWALAQWAVARADQLGVARVETGGRVVGPAPPAPRGRRPPRRGTAPGTVESCVTAGWPTPLAGRTRLSGRSMPT